MPKTAGRIKTRSSQPVPAIPRIKPCNLIVPKLTGIALKPKTKTKQNKQKKHKSAVYTQMLKLCLIKQLKIHA